jgi:hypothetical protein
MVAECDMQVAGKLASLGYSIIKKKAEENFAEFRTRLLKVLEECPVLRVQESLMGECVAPLVGLPSEPIVDGGRGLESVVEVAADVSVETHLEVSISETLEAVEQAPTTAQLDDAPGPQVPPLPTTQACVRWPYVHFSCTARARSRRLSPYLPNTAKMRAPSQEAPSYWSP